MAVTNPDIAQRSSNENLYQSPIGKPILLEGPLNVVGPTGATYQIAANASVATLITLLGSMGLVDVT
jgi:hypothetical protein